MWQENISERQLFAFQNTQLNIGLTLYCSIGSDIFLGLFEISLLFRFFRL